MRLRHDSIFSVNVFAAHIDEWKQKKKEILSLVDFNNKDAASDEELNYTDHNLYGIKSCLLYTSPSPRDRQKSRMPSSA